jgi:cellobiose phosphorylase
MSTKKSSMSGVSWKFSKENDGSFYVENANHLPVLYFPLMNTKGMKSFVTPELKGDVCKDFHHYLTTPTVTEEIHRNISSRNFWIKADNKDPWSATGQSVFQKSNKWDSPKDDYSISANIGAFTTKRKQNETGLEATITTFIPENDDFVELLKITVSNTGSENQTFRPTYALPMFGRSADNVRDHRQVTTMFQENFVEEYGVRIKPKIMHDESSHSVNYTNYVVLGFGEKGAKPEGIWARLHDFIGQSGSLDNPEAIYKDLKAPILTDLQLHGKEAVAGLNFKEKTLAPGEKADYIIVHGITDHTEDLDAWKEKYGDVDKVEEILEATLNFWKEKLNSVDIHTGDKHYDNWVKWIEYQVKCRQIFGNSFLPDYGYGRGGRGWRDLWQDLLSIFLVDPKSAHEEIVNCFKGIRIDGTNATIIGEQPGEFKADRNNIPRTWCDHGTWPVFVLNFYLNQTGDLDILNKEITYWKDMFINRSKMIDGNWEDEQGHSQRTSDNEIYTASIFEHLLIQQLSAFYNVSDQNILLLEGADWNDTYDMAREKGASVCFFSFYAYNFIILADILKKIKASGVQSIAILEEITLLLDYLPGQYRIDYQSPKAKRELLDKYFKSVAHSVSGNKKMVLIDDLIIDLESKSKHISAHILEQEIVKTKEGDRFFNGHYDNLENRIGGEKEDGVMMDLTSQVMPILCKIADKKMSAEVYESIKKILKDDGIPGIRLTSEFKNIDLNIGRITGFVYGYKEHGSKWVQQNIMLAYALYDIGLVAQANEIMKEVYEIANNTATAKIFPGVPSYFDNQNKGAYAYLTGSSSWYLLTLITQVFGVKGVFGDLHLEPKLSKEYFNKEGVAHISTNYGGYAIDVTYQNDKGLDYGEYGIGDVTINGHKVKGKRGKKNASITLDNFKELFNNTNNKITIELI